MQTLKKSQLLGTQIEVFQPGWEVPRGGPGVGAELLVPGTPGASPPFLASTATVQIGFGLKEQLNKQQRTGIAPEEEEEGVKL